MNPIINYIAAMISRRIEAGSSRGAWIGGVVGVILLGGLAVIGWATGATGFMGLGLTIAGTLLGAVAGALIGAGFGPEDHLVTSDQRKLIFISDYNRKLIALVPMVGGLALGIGATVVYINDPSHKEANVLIGTAIFCGLAAIGSLIFLARQDLSVTLAEDVRVNRLFSEIHFPYSQVIECGLNVPSGGGPPFREGIQYSFYIKLPDRTITIPVNSDQASDLTQRLPDFIE